MIQALFLIAVAAVSASQKCSAPHIILEFISSDKQDVGSLFDASFVYLS